MLYVNKTLFYTYYRWLQQKRTLGLSFDWFIECPEFLEVMALPHNLIRAPQSHLLACLTRWVNNSKREIRIG